MIGIDSTYIIVFGLALIVLVASYDDWWGN